MIILIFFEKKYGKFTSDPTRLDETLYKLLSKLLRFISKSKFHKLLPFMYWLINSTFKDE